MITDPVSVPGFRPPRQERSRATAERLAAATDGLLTERGPREFTIHDIVKRAESSVGSFYARFEDRDAAVRYVQARFWAEAEARWRDYLDAARWEGMAPVQIVARVIRDLVRTMMADRARLRAFLLQALAEEDDGLLERTAALDRFIADGMAELLRERSAGMGRPAPAEAPREDFMRVLGAIRDAVIFGEPSEAATQRLVLSLVRMYAGAPGAPAVPQTWGDLLRLCADRRGTGTSPGR